MTRMTLDLRHVRQRNLLFLTTPHLWPVYPFLPVIRRLKPSELECGLLYDAKGLHGLFGFSSTVFATNLFSLPQSLPEFLALPRHVYDSAEELFDDDWRID